MYVDAYHNRETDEIWVVERQDGERRFVEFPINYTTYYEDPMGDYKSIFGTNLKKFTAKTHKEFQKEIKQLSNRTLFESDLNPIFRCLEEHYKGTSSPDLNVVFFDIEVGFDVDRGFAPVEDPFSPITAISLYLNWVGKNITLCLYPETFTREEAEKELEGLEDTYIFDTEEELLKVFLDLIEDADVLSGWNSTKFDIPYIVGRILRTLGEDYARDMCLWGLKPRKRTFTQFKKDFITYEIYGRVHLDYLDLYMKHSMQELHTYRLDYVGEIEVDENKVPYEGTLDQLYKQDYRKFIEYSKQDVMILVKLDAKKKFINLANQIAHTNTVLIPTTMGSVALVEQAIINEAHDLGLKVPNRKQTNDKLQEEALPEGDEEDEEGGEAVAGAYVVDPKTGLHDWIGSVDINSLYPSTIRTLNMSPETLIGQLKPELTEEYLNRKVREEKMTKTEALHNMFGTLEYQEVLKKSDQTITVEFDRPEKEVFELTAEEIYSLIFETDNGWCLSANGTIFKTDIQGIIPHLLERWYRERKEMQAKAKDFLKQSDKEEDENKKKDLKAQGDYWDTMQYIRKILLNSLYGALLNPYCRFFDKRVGQSVTLTGRCITQHMGSKINEIITGDYNHVGDAVAYGDTDSVYFSLATALKRNENLGEIFGEFEFTPENVIDLYDAIADEANASFNDFLIDKFNVNPDFAVIAAGREIVALKALFIKKKRYAALVVDQEGNRQDKNGKPGKIKAMGLDLKRSDTPKFVQTFLEELLKEVLTGASEDQVIQSIKKFKKEFKDKSSWDKGTPKKVNSLTDYTNRYQSMMDPDELIELEKMKLKASDERARKRIQRDIDKLKKVTIPGHVMASIQYNRLKKMYNDNYSMPIQDGQKIIVCKLKDNPLGVKSVAYPIDEVNLPKWFKELPFDDDLMEQTIVDKKVHNLLDILGWDLERGTNTTTFDDLFSV